MPSIRAQIYAFAIDTAAAQITYKPQSFPLSCLLFGKC